MKVEIKTNEDMARLKIYEDMGVDIDSLEFLQGYEYAKGVK